jgi:hypothetical protein
VDFWRVERLGPVRLLRLCAEMRIPGRLWLPFEVVRGHDGPWGTAGDDLRRPRVRGARVRYALYPLHRRVFAGMLAGIGRAIRASDAATDCSRNVSHGHATVAERRSRRRRARPRLASSEYLDRKGKGHGLESF